jgi:RNA recognition motif 2
VIHNAKILLFSKWFYVEYYDVRETQAAFQDLHDRPHVLGTQFTLFTTKLLPPSRLSASSASPPPTRALGLNLQNIIPFPSTEGSLPEEPPASRFSRPRSASAEAGDGVKAFSLASTRLAEDLRRRITAPPDWGSEFVDRTGERRRSQSFDASQRVVDNQASCPTLDHHDLKPYVQGTQQAACGHGHIGTYDVHPYTQSFIPACPSTYTPEYILPRPANAHIARRIAPSNPHMSSSRVSSQTSQSHLKYRTPSLLEPGEQSMDNNLNIARIESGQDMRTTVMIKNIPNKMTDKDLITFIERVCSRRIDFFYLRMDFKNGTRSLRLQVTFFTVSQGVMLGMRS